MTFREANGRYQRQDYQQAAAKYEETLAHNPTDPQLLTSYFFLGNSYDNLYKPSRKGEADNDELLTKAVENYKKAAEARATTYPNESRRSRCSTRRGVRPGKAERPVTAGADTAAR